MSDYLLGVDIGTSSCKAVVFGQDGEIIESRAGDYPVYYPAPGYAEQKPCEWWESVCGAIRGILSAGNVKPADIKAVGVDGQSWSAIVVERDGNVLFDDPIWMDTRAAGICAELGKNIGEKAIFGLCGNPLAPTYTSPKIIWFRRNFPEAFRSAYKVLQSNSYIVYRLTGEFTQDLSQGYGLHFFDMRKGAWDAEMAKEMGVDLGLMPEIMPCHAIAGTVTREAAAVTGLLPGTPVVAGGLDAACGTLGVGVVADGQTQEQSGQAGGMSVCLERCVAHKKLIMSRHAADGRWLLQGGTVGGGGTLKWLKEKLLIGLDFAEMDGLAAESPPGSGGIVYLPYMAGERSPLWDQNAKGVYFGLSYAHSRNDIIRATMEGVAYSLTHNIRTAEEAGAVIKTMNASGGAAESGIWTQIKADVTGKEIAVAQSGAATTLGAAILAGVAVGMYKDFDDAVDKTVRIRKTYTPNWENHEIYGKYYGVYLRLYENLRELMREMQ
ncbi:MAG: FGGY-family carbohydrate kinase [Defluviitaleaceae bacterium]|nr:FGGY-family carbohydrate kinase [Defluviitaleaceae bacterium]